VEYKTENDALKDLEGGNSWGYMYFSDGFSGEYYNRASSGTGGSYSNSNDSTLKVVMDSSSKKQIQKVN